MIEKTTENEPSTDVLRGQDRLNKKSNAGHLLVVAGEASGDSHAARVVAELKKSMPGLKLFGLGGQSLLEQGLELSDDPECLNLIGLSEVLGGLKRILAVRKKILAEVDARSPRAALLVDLPGFNLNLAYHLRKRGVKVVYYIAPQAWAWRKGRLKKIRRRVDKLCVIFPFEEKFFRDAGINTSFVGHPLMEESFVARTQPADHDGIFKIALVPGSRPSEIRRLFPAMIQAAGILQDSSGPFEFVLPVAPGLDQEWILSIVQEHGLDVQLVHGGATEALAGARAAFVTSGTATLEAAIQGVPMVVVYRVSRTSHALVKPVYRLKHFCIVNILAGKTVVPELLQASVRSDILATEIEPMLDDGPARRQVKRGLEEVVAKLRGPRPSVEVARLVAEAMEDHT